MSVRIASFNAENLMARFDFSAWRKIVPDSEFDRSNRPHTRSDFRYLEKVGLITHEDDARQMTALAIADCHADIVCLQEVEDLETLEAFEENYLTPITGLDYPIKEWREGNDTRGIDVALMARKKTADGEPIEITEVISHRNKTFQKLDVYSDDLKKLGIGRNERVFRRDCLEVNLRIGGKPVTIFVCHFKSMGSGRENVDGRLHTMPVRHAEAQAVRTIIERKFGENRAGKMRWLICGDLNDYRERLVIEGDKLSGYQFKPMPEQVSGLKPLFDGGFADDLIARRHEDDRWTLYYASGISENVRRPDQRPIHHLVQLDYLLASPSLAGKNDRALPHIIREGQPHRAIIPPDQQVERYPRTGWDRPKASDHCPVAVTLKMV